MMVVTHNIDDAFAAVDGLKSRIDTQMSSSRHWQNWVFLSAHRRLGKTVQFPRHLQILHDVEVNP